MIAPEKIKNNAGIKISFGIINNINWKRSKRFMHGGLLLLSSDNFETGLFATVVERNEKDLENGCILIELCEGAKFSQNMFKTSFVMIESKIYFKPYLAVLNALQHMNALNFPMASYLINADASIKLPKYLAGKQTLTYKGVHLSIEPGHDWPVTARKLIRLDETQCEAFKCALTNEFAII